MSEEASIFVARESDLDALRGLWAKAREGAPHILRLQAPFGGGRRALSAEFLRGVSQAEEGTLIWRVNCLDQENGLQWLVRMYGSLIATLSRDALARGKVEMVLNAQLPGQPKRVQDWYQQFISSMKEAKTNTESGQVQLRLPQDNPLVGLIEVVAAIGRKIPLIIELQNPYAVNSLALAMFVDGVQAESADGGKILQILFDEPDGEIPQALFPMPLLDLYKRREEEIAVHTIEPWGEAEVSSYLGSKDLEANAARLAEIAGGRPGFVAELIDILVERGQLSGDLEGITLSSLVPLGVDEGELDVPDEPPAEGERKHATGEDIGRVTFFAALLGAAFPSNLVADMGNFDRDSIDDLLDAMKDLFEEVQFSNELGTWIYRFRRGSYQEGVLQNNDSDEGHALARGVGEFMERYLVPRGYGFIVKTARVYAEHGATQRAAIMRANALTQDAQEMWGLAYDFTRYFDELPFPEPMLRTIYMNLLDRLVAQGNLQAAEKVHTEITAWATEHEDRDLTAWLLFNGSKLDLRRQDLFRARDRANDVMKLYEGMENRRRMAEISNHLAAIELQDGNMAATLEHTQKAEELARIKLEDGRDAHMPDIIATCHQLRGLVARRQGRLDDAIEAFHQANQEAGGNGIAGLALDSGLSYGEALLAARRVEEGRNALERVLQIARALRNGLRERQACELLAQAEGALKNYDKALPLALRALELTKALRLEQALPIDLYNAGFFHLLNKKPTEALAYFGQSEERVAQLGNHPVVKELYYFKGVAHRQANQPDAAKRSLSQALPLLKDAKDWRKTCLALEHLADLEEGAGETGAARTHLSEAVELAQKANLREERKSLKKKLDALGR
ncbi:MAG TPA: tetratricopeptide repeat protein [Deltaproteobacteria bacterium]|nr:tetratricopeptide repeat protein [Deltaproteobacteria bacterium]